jgi:hypothetical protein
MNRRQAFPFFLAVALPTAAQAQQAINAQEVLAASDAIRNPGRAFAVKVTLSEFEAGKLLDSSTLMSYTRPFEGGQLASLVAFLEPARDAGKLLLRSGADLWFYDPGTKASIRISPQQRLLGQAANGDVVTVNFARDYEATLRGEEDVVDGERKQRRAWRLALASRGAGAAYASAELWVDMENNRPIRARYFADSGRLLKTAFFRRYQRQLGTERPTEMVIIDGLNPQSVTLMRFSEWATPNIPAAWFQREHLPRFQPE